MSSGSVLYDGLLIGKGAKYTQTRGVTPDKISVRMIPQTTPIAAFGDIQIGFGLESLTIKDCLADKSLISIRGAFDGVVIFEDRRWRWSRVATVSFHVNERWADGTINPGSVRNLRLIVGDLLTAMGEVSYSITDVSDVVFP